VPLPLSSLEKLPGPLDLAADGSGRIVVEHSLLEAVGITRRDGSQQRVGPKSLDKHAPRLLKIAASERLQLGSAFDVLANKSIEHHVLRCRMRPRCRQPHPDEPIVQGGRQSPEPRGRVSADGLPGLGRSEDFLDAKQHALGEPLCNLAEPQCMPLAVGMAKLNERTSVLLDGNVGHGLFSGSVYWFNG
jgi:hypothetical protein